MPTDAKLGLAVGVGLVIVVAVVFFGKPTPSASALPTPGQPQAAGSQRVSLVPASPLPPTKPRIHVVQSGDTLFSIARQHYGDGDRFADIYQANKDVLSSPDRLPLGASLRLP